MPRVRLDSGDLQAIATYLDGLQVMAANVEFPARRCEPGTSQATHERLSRTWATPRGVIGWLSAVDHKIVGARTLVAAVAFFTLGGLLALADAGAACRIRQPPHRS